MSDKYQYLDMFSQLLQIWRNAKAVTKICKKFSTFKLDKFASGVKVSPHKFS